MGGGSSKSSEVVKAEEFTQSSLTDESFSVVNLNMRSGFGRASMVLVILGLSSDFLKANYFARPNFFLENFAQVKGHKKT